jgi:hypothetical protein
MVMKERDYEGYKQYVCTKCGYDTFDKAEAKAHDEAAAHEGPTSEPQTPKVQVIE